MEIFNEFINFIARTNLFNFIVFATIICLLAMKLDAKGKIENARANVIETIDNSETEKNNSVSELDAMQESISRINDEILEILNKSEENAQIVGNKILDDAKNTAITYQNNAQKAIENKQAMLKNDLLKRASSASIELAKMQIINELNQNPDLHNKLIDESIEQVNGVELK